MLTLGLALLLMVVLACGSGAMSIPAGEVIATLADVLWQDTPAAARSATQLVVLDLRLPRIVLGLLTGAGLALSGAVLQGLFRNPLADPSLIGVASGAALGAALMIVLGNRLLPGLMQHGGPYMLSLAAFIGALLVSAMIYRFAQHQGQVGLGLLLLAGIAISALVEAGIGFLTFMANDEQLRTLTFWRFGSLGNGNWHLVGVLCMPVLLAGWFMLRMAVPLNVLALGESEAQHLGMAVDQTKKRLLVAIAILVGTLVSATGMIGFVGLVAPHLIRLLLGPDHRILLPACALLGALLVLIADTLARTLVSPAELPIGMLTAMMGAPVFLLLLYRERHRLHRF